MDERPHTEIPIGDPLRDAWEAHKKTDDFINSRKWAATANYPHLDGSLWAMFAEGYKAGRVNAFAALAEHLGCKPEDLKIDLVALVEALEDYVPSLDAIDDGQWNEHTGDLVLKEHEWGAIKEARDKLRQVLAAFDTVDRADKE